MLFVFTCKGLEWIELSRFNTGHPAPKFTCPVFPFTMVKLSLKGAAIISITPSALTSAISGEAANDEWATSDVHNVDSAYPHL